MSHQLTTHARLRMQQRGISPEALVILLELGEVSDVPGGKQVVYLGRARREEIGHRAMRVRARDRVKGLYAVTDEYGTVITVGHRYRRIARI